MENKNKHTPGPWKAKTGEHLPGDTFAVIVTEKLECIAESFATGSINSDQQMANAKLIAAAPELLEALQNLCEQAKSNNDYDCDSSLQNAVEMAESLIRQATT